MPLDALVTTPLGGRREIYCEPTDVRFGSKERSFEIDATFAELSVPQQGRFISAVTDHYSGKRRLRDHLRRRGKSFPCAPTCGAVI
jgi:putative ATP-dependent endonuclease of OLD family